MSSKVPSIAPAAAAIREHSSIQSSKTAALEPETGPRDAGVAGALAGSEARGVPPRVGPELPGPAIEPTPREGLSPVSFGQQLLWFFAQMFPEAPTYNE